MTRKLSNWLSSHLDYTAKQESPEFFHLWSGISAIAAVIERKCWYDKGFYDLYPNHYIILVSESALSRKTTAADLAVRLVKETKKVYIMRDSFTKPVFMDRLNKVKQTHGTTGSSMLLYADELMTCLGKGAVESGLIATLTQAYKSQEVEYHTQHSVTATIDDVCINFLGCTTLDWAATVLSGYSAEGGFPGRNIFVVQERARHREPFPVLTQKEYDLRRDLVFDLLEINKLSGQFTATNEAKDAYSPWYKALKEPDDMRLKGYYGRLGDHVLKLAMILSISETDDLTIKTHHIKNALKILNQNEKLMLNAFRGVAHTKDGVNTDRVYQQLVTMGGRADHSILLKKNYSYMNKIQFKECIDTLDDMNLIDIIISGRKTRYEVRKGNKP